MLRTNVQVADAPVSRITYEDSGDNGAVRQFYLNNMSAQSFAGGGAVLDSGAASTISNTIELLIQRADQYSYTSTNCN
ncbi:MAG: hypothetical protein HRT44_10790 [Bdellovibrionales bacterium]|nr:hypothetical protein [Bdellovibrionales bacterium]